MSSLQPMNAITSGQVTIREFHRKDEAKVHLDKRAGVPVNFNPLDPSMVDFK